MMEGLLVYLAGAATAGYVVASLFFLRFWRKTADRLFLAFGLAFALLALNQVIATFLGAGDERLPFAYVLRVLGFLLILLAVVDKNLAAGRR
ncbi:MAG TPA: DUF5985 family protein [Gammaproteobacteria bacterium]